MNGIWSEWIHRGLVFLVISCPCALVISIPLSFFGGIGNASRKGILIKGSNYLEALNNLDIVVFDKTGTLTKGIFEVVKITPVKDYTKEEVLEMAAKAEVFSSHPIAFSILKAYGKEVSKDNIKDYKVISGYGISINSESNHILVGNNKLMLENGISFDESDEIGTKIYVAINKKFENDYVECAKAIAHEYRHVFQLFYANTLNDNRARRWRMERLHYLIIHRFSCTI